MFVWGFKQNPYISGKPVPGVEPGTGGFMAEDFNLLKYVGFVSLSEISFLVISSIRSNSH